MIQYEIQKKTKQHQKNLFMVKYHIFIFNNLKDGG